MMELRILRGGKKEESRITNLDFRSTEFGLFRDLLGSILWEIVSERTRVWESRWIFKAIHPQDQECSAPDKLEIKQEAYMDKQVASDGVRKTEVRLELNLVKKLKGNKKAFYRYIS